MDNLLERTLYIRTFDLIITIYLLNSYSVLTGITPKRSINNKYLTEYAGFCLPLSHDRFSP